VDYLESVLAEHFDQILRLGAATLAGMIIGLNRDLKGKPTGVRTLGLVGLGTALVTVGTIEYASLALHPDALSRVVQGLIQGVLTGIGFIGAGAILRDREQREIEGLTTAASVWVTAAAGIVCGLANWPLVTIAVVMTLGLLVMGHGAEILTDRLLRKVGLRKGPTRDSTGNDSASEE
jgi:putative Mg2+ transporter-C (MgtC) family protein